MEPEVEPGFTSQSARTRTTYPTTTTDFLNAVRRGARLGTGHELRASRTTDSQAFGVQLRRFDLFYQGVPVADASVTAWVKDGLVVGGRVDVPIQVPTSTIPAFSPVEAQDRAERWHQRALRSPRGAVFGPPPRPCRLQIRTRQSVLTSRTGETRTVSSTALEYDCAVMYGEDSAGMIVDATTGSLRDYYPLIRQWTPTPASGFIRSTASTGYFAAEFQLPNDYRLRSATSTTLDNLGADPNSLTSAVDYLSTGPIFAQAVNLDGVEVHWGTEMAWYAYSDTLGVDPFQGLNGSNGIFSFSNVNTSLGAYFVTTSTAQLVYSGAPADTAPEVVAHEVGHAMMHAHAAEPEYLGEGAAISEGAADAFSQLAEHRRTGTTDYLFVGRPGLDPGSVGLPDVYGFPPWLPPLPANASNDFGHAHHNAMILVHWWSLASKGQAATNSAGTSYDVAGMGPELMSSVLFDALKTLNADDGFMDLRDATYVASTQICGEFSNLRRSTQAAWHAVGLSSLQSPALGYASPITTTPNVEPWNTRIVWQTHASGAPESEWILQISESSTFPPTNTLEFQVTTTSVDNNVTVGEWYAGLDPDTTYHWRVRRRDTDPAHDCWRPTRTFHTADAAPILLSPTLGPKVYPWELPFLMQLAPGTDRVEITVSESPDMNTPIFAPQTFTVDPEGGWQLDQSVELTVLVDRDLFWTAQAFDDETGTSSPQSNPEAFVTSIPKPTVTAPADGSTQYPWNIEHTWPKLKGAVEYTGELEHVSGNFGIDIFRIPEPYRSVTRSFWHTAQNQRRWRVKALGPPLGSTHAPAPPESAEESEFSDDATYTLDFDATEVTVTSPKWNPVSKGCFVLGQPVQITWDGVPDAESYRLDFYALRDNSSGDQAPNVFRSNQSSYSETLPGSVGFASVGGVPTQNGGGSGVIGYAVRGVAHGPEGFQGKATQQDADFGTYFFRPTVPTPLDPSTVPTGALNGSWEPGWLHMVWATDYAERRQYRLEVFDNTTCTGSPSIAQDITSYSSGATAYQVDAGSGVHSWRVRPRYAGHCSIAAIQWSACVADTSLAPTPPPPPNQVIAVYGQTLLDGWLPVPTGKLFVAFSAVPQATSYFIETREIGTSNAVVHGRGASALYNEKAQILDAMCAQNPWDPNCPATPSSFLPDLHIIELPAGSAQEEVRVQACNGTECGAFSNWLPAI